MAKRDEVQESRKTGRILKHCDCQSKFQDRRYGKGKRLCNRTVTDKVRCTVCGKAL